MKKTTLFIILFLLGFIVNGKAQIVEAEYFFDTDPGIGNATAITITEGIIIDETLAIEIPMGMSNGAHYLHIRVKDQNGTWSLYTRAPFEVDNTLALDGIETIDFKVFPNPVSNRLNIHFQDLNDYLLRIFDITGKELMNLETSQLLNNINISNYVTGIYFLKIIDAKTNQESTTKVIKL